MRYALFISNNEDYIDYLRKNAKQAQLCCIVSNGIEIKADAPVFQLNSQKHSPEIEKKMISFLEKNSAEWIVLANYCYLVKQDLIDKFRNRIISVHPSLLPLYPGKIRKVYEEVLNRGSKLTGCTVHFVDEGVDTGRILVQEPVKILENDTVMSFHKRMIEAEQKALAGALDLIAKEKV
ncbi:MAG: formyltransferase family protein [Candidatus Micrarchaeota archaeon]